MITDRDMRDQVRRAVDHAAEYDVEAIVDAIQTKYGTTDIDRVNPDAFWDIVSRHVRTATSHEYNQDLAGRAIRYLENLEPDQRLTISYEGFGAGSFPSVTPDAAILYLTELASTHGTHYRYKARLNCIDIRTATERRSFS